MALFNAADIRSRTATARLKLLPNIDENDPVETSDRARQLLEHLEQCDFGCQQQNVFRLVELITGETIPYNRSEDDDYNSPPIEVGVAYVFNGTTIMVTSIDEDGDGNFIAGNFNTEVGGISYLDPSEKYHIANESQVEEIIKALFE